MSIFSIVPFLAMMYLFSVANEPVKLGVTQKDIANSSSLSKLYFLWCNVLINEEVSLLKVIVGNLWLSLPKVDSLKATFS